MKKLLIIIYCLFIIWFSYTENIKDPKIINIANITNSEKDGALGYKPELCFAGIYCAPTTFVISEKGTIYVCDTINYRINVYDSNLNYIRKIADKDNSSGSKAIKLNTDNKENIIYYEFDRGLVKIDKQGKILFQILPAQLPKEIKNNQNYFIFDSYIVFYNSDGINLIDSTGFILTGQKAKTKIEEIQKKSLDTNMKLDSEIQNLPGIESFFMEKGVIARGATLLTGDFKIHRDYFNRINNTKSSKSKIKNEDRVELLYKRIRYIERNIIGFDIDGNSYWKQSGKGLQLVVLSKYGSTLDIFNIIEMNNSIIAIAPNGDIYFMKINIEKKDIEFKKIIREW